MEHLTERLRTDLTEAMRVRDRTTVRVLRTALAALANAEAQPNTDSAVTSRGAEGRIAGASAGVGATETARRHLDEHEARLVLTAERDERLASAADLEEHGATEAADALRAEAALLECYLS